MTANRLLSRLAKVRPTGTRRWTALCPAHDDRSPSLSIEETEDGRVLVHCFAGCGVDEVVASVDLRMSDLFPERERALRPAGASPRSKRAFHSSELLALVADEALVAAIVASNLADGRMGLDEGRKRLWEAASRLAHAVEVSHGY